MKKSIWVDENALFILDNVKKILRSKGMKASYSDAIRFLAGVIVIGGSDRDSEEVSRIRQDTGLDG